MFRTFARALSTSHAGHSRSKDGVASARLCPRIYRPCKDFLRRGVAGSSPATTTKSFLDANLVSTSLENASTESAQELEHALLRRVGERQRGDRDRLAGRQRVAVG